MPGRKAFYQFAMEDYVDPWAREWVGPAMDGDVDAAFSLICAVQSAKRGEVARGLWHARIPRPAFQCVLNQVWSHDHRELLVSVPARQQLRAMFTYARFETEHLPEKFQVWRGVSGPLGRLAPNQYAWTMTREVACWFAMRNADRHGSPLVMTAHVERDQVLFHSNESGENEVVVLDPLETIVDGSEGDWHTGFLAHGDEIKHK